MRAETGEVRIVATQQTRYITLKRYIHNERVTASHFEVKTNDIAPLQDGEVLLRPVAFSMDPTLRGQMTGIDGSYFLDQLQAGDPVIGWAVSEVIESRDDRFRPGDQVIGYTEWAELAIYPAPLNPVALQVVDERITSPSLALGVYGLIGGITAYTGIVNAGKVQAGETVVVSAASGSIGSIVGQIAKLKGATVIGLAGSPEKRDILTDTLGFDHALDYRAEDFADQLASAAPKGADLYFDGVGGAVSDTVMWQMRQLGRVIVVGLISTYDHDDTAWQINFKPILANGLTVQGYSPFHYAEHFGEATGDLLAWVTAGDITPLETIEHGFDAIPQAYANLFTGANTGKMIVAIP
jgi:NADPH-dependent curcumin reductase CurA